MNQKVGEGTYGCVFKPSLKCNTNIGSYENKVSKVMKNSDAADELREYRKYEPDAVIIAHPECPTDVVDEADFSGSTAGMIDYVRKNKPEKVLLITECSMGSNIADEVPEVNFLGPCNLCPHMQRITLEKILWSLHTGNEEVIIEEELAAKARRAVQRMIDLK